MHLCSMPGREGGRACLTLLSSVACQELALALVSEPPGNADSERSAGHVRGRQTLRN